ncbi:MYND finger domain-containing protein [Giardia muris]|uniref:MYND finger domain-containing protein n=1 Tax=Giardia muris TaxID=5742 RepID=A0A4Z1SQE6_GIAMU|nr:MYND finger domain-containing protein [Giardia muris]|eukprot:TNJ27135.1 MYND finger domain-containing protein [Giardia muris]
MRVGISRSPGCCNQCLASLRTRGRCSRCKDVSYCGRACQEADWPAHKLLCGRSSKEPLDALFAKCALLALQREGDGLFHNLKERLTVTDVVDMSKVYIDFFTDSSQAFVKCVFIRVEVSFMDASMLLPYTGYMDILPGLENHGVQILGYCYNSSDVPPLDWMFDLTSRNTLIQGTALTLRLVENKGTIHPPLVPPMYRLPFGSPSMEFKPILPLPQADAISDEVGLFFILPLCILGGTCTSYLTVGGHCAARNCSFWDSIDLASTTPDSLSSKLQLLSENISHVTNELRSPERRKAVLNSTSPAETLLAQYREYQERLTLSYNEQAFILPMYPDTFPILLLKHAYVSVMRDQSLREAASRNSLVRHVDTVLKHSPFSSFSIEKFVLSMLRTWVRVDTSASYWMIIKMQEPLKVCNDYLLEKLEGLSPPPERASDKEKIPKSVLSRLQETSKVLIPPHKLLLGMLEEIYGFAEPMYHRAKDGPITAIYNDLEHMIGLVDARLDSLESWLDPEDVHVGEEEKVDLALIGKPTNR